MGVLNSLLAGEWPGDPEIYQLLLDCASSDEHIGPRQRALSELARGWQGDADVYQLLFDRASSAESEWERQT